MFPALLLVLGTIQQQIRRPLFRGLSVPGGCSCCMPCTRDLYIRCARRFLIHPWNSKSAPSSSSSKSCQTKRSFAVGNGTCHSDSCRGPGRSRTSVIRRRTCCRQNGPGIQGCATLPFPHGNTSASKIALSRHPGPAYPRRTRLDVVC